MREVRVERAGHVYVFRVRADDRAGCCDLLAAAARDPDLQFDWFDAAAAAYTFGRESTRS